MADIAYPGTELKSANRQIVEDAPSARSEWEVLH